MQVSNVQNTSTQIQYTTNHMTKTEQNSFDKVLDETLSVSDVNEDPQRVYFQISYENIKGMSDEEIDIYFPYAPEHINTYKDMTDEEGSEYVPYTPQEKRDNIRYMRDMAAGFSHNDAINKAIFEEAKYIVGKAKIVDKENANLDGDMTLFDGKNKKLQFSIDLFMKKLEFGNQAPIGTGALTEIRSIGFSDPEPIKSWKIDADKGIAYDYGYNHEIGKNSKYQVLKDLQAGVISMNEGRDIESNVYSNEKLTDEQAVYFLNTLFKISNDMLSISKDDELKNRQNEVDKYTRMFDTYAKETESSKKSENEVLLKQYTKNNKANLLEKNIS